MSRSQKHLLDKYAGLAFFNAWTREELTRLDRTATELEFEPGEIVSRDLETGAEFLVLVVGRATVDGGPRHGEELVAGDHIGDIAIFVAGRRPAALVAQTYCRALLMSTPQFRSVLATTPSFGRVLANRLAQRVAQLIETPPIPAQLAPTRTSPTRLAR